MAKFPFTLESWLKDKSQKVETRDGRSARIICIDAKADDGACIIALIPGYGGEEAYQFFPNGKAFSSKSSVEDCADLFIITPEPEFSEFEKRLWEIMKSEGSAIGQMDKFTQDDKRVFHAYSDQLLALARKELCEQIVDHTKEAYDNGKAEALKDLPRWRKEQGEMELAAYGIIGGGVASQENPRVYLNGHSIDLYSLEKLPGFND